MKYPSIKILRKVYRQAVKIERLEKAKEKLLAERTKLIKETGSSHLKLIKTA